MHVLFPGEKSNPGWYSGHSKIGVQVYDICLTQRSLTKSNAIEMFFKTLKKM